MPMISTTAKKRRADIKAGNDLYAGAPAVSRKPVAAPPRSREAISASDLQQIVNRQQAEALPEGDVRRKPRPPRAKGRSTY